MPLFLQMTRLLLLALLLAPAAAMDFVGQKHNERTFQIMVVVFGLVGFVVGWIEQNFRWTFLCLAAGGGISAVICLPDWPWWNLHPLEWLRSGMRHTPAGLAQGVPPLVCEQRAGDVLFVPHLWGHGTINRGETVGVATPFSLRGGVDYGAL